MIVEDVQSVEWNKAAFKSLAIAAETKQLIEALITNKIEASEGVDFVDGKGTGLIILLHGLVYPFRQSSYRLELTQP